MNYTDLNQSVEAEYSYSQLNIQSLKFIINSIVNRNHHFLFIIMNTILKSQIQNKEQKIDPFYKQKEKLYGWIAFVKFYFFDTSDAFIKITEGTGFLNSNWTMITACHNLYLPNEKDKCSHCVIYLRDPNKKNEQIVIKSRPVDQWFQNRELDIAQCDWIRGVFFASASDLELIQQSKQQELFVTGFSNRMKTSIDITNDLVVVRSNFRNIDKNTVRYSGQTNKGLSGSPVIYRTDKDEVKLKIVGLHLSRKPETQDCKGLLFSDEILNLIYSWMGRYQLEKVKIESRLSMMMAYCMKIFETVKKQLLDKDEDGVINRSRLQFIKREDDYELQREGREKQYMVRNMDRQKAIAKKHEKLMNSLINNSKQQEIYETIGDIYTLEDQCQLANVFIQQYRQIINPFQQHNYSSVMDNEQINKMKLKHSNKFQQKNGCLQLQLINRPLTKDVQVNTLTQQQMKREYIQFVSKLNIIPQNIKEKSIVDQQLQQRKISFKEQLIAEDRNKDYNNKKECFAENSSYEQKWSIGIQLQKQINHSSVQSEFQQYFESQKKQNNKFELRSKQQLGRLSSGDNFSNSYVATSNISSPSFYKTEQNIFSSPCKSDNKLSELYSQKFILEKMNRRQIVKDTALLEFPYNCIGQIMINHGNGQQLMCGTGFLIASNLVLTAAHNFQDYSKLKRDIQYIDFRLMQKNQDQFFVNKIKVSKYKINPNFISFSQQQASNIEFNTPRGGSTKQSMMKDVDQERLRYDYALLQLQTPIKRSQYFELMRDIDTFPELTLCGLTKASQYSQVLESRSNVYKDNNILFYEMDTYIGQSGSPVYFRDGSNISLLGIHKSAQRVNSVNMGTMITNQMISMIQQWARQMNISLTISTFKEKEDFKQMKINELNTKLQFMIKQNQNMKEDKQKYLQDLRTIQNDINFNLQKQIAHLKQQKRKIKFEFEFQKEESDMLRQKCQELSLNIQNLKNLYESEKFFEYEIIGNKPLSKRKSNRRLDKSVQIVGYGYSQIATNLQAIKDANQTTDLILKNTCACLHILDVYKSEFRVNIELTQTQIQIYQVCKTNIKIVYLILYVSKYHSLIYRRILQLKQRDVDNFQISVHSQQFEIVSNFLQSRKYQLSQRINHIIKEQILVHAESKYNIIQVCTNKFKQRVYNDLLRCKNQIQVVYNIRYQVERITQIIPQFTNLQNLTIYCKHPLLRHQVFDEFVVVLNKTALQSFKIVMDPSLESFQIFEQDFSICSWTKNLKARLVKKKYCEWKT